MEWLLAGASAVWLGLLTSISPCPLATNIAAVSFVSHRIDRRAMVLASGALYTLGRSLTYIGLSVLIVNALVNVPAVSDFLQRHMNKLLGFVLTLTGMVLLDLLPLPVPAMVPTQRSQERLGRAGAAGALALGALFALAFCPVSAALFFGSLVPLAVKAQSSVGLPFLYGVGTAVPVLAVAVLVATGSVLLDRAHRGLATVGVYTKKITGGVLIAVGIYFILRYVFGVW